MWATPSANLYTRVVVQRVVGHGLRAGVRVGLVGGDDARHPVPERLQSRVRVEGVGAVRLLGGLEDRHEVPRDPDRQHGVQHVLCG